MSQTETESTREDLILKFEGMGFPFEVAVKLTDEVMYGRGVAQENEYVVRPGRGFNTGGSVGGIGQFSELELSNALPSFEAPTPKEEIKNAIRRGTTSDEEFFALAKAQKTKSPIAQQFYMDIANRIRMGIV